MITDEWDADALDQFIRENRETLSKNKNITKQSIPSSQTSLKSKGVSIKDKRLSVVEESETNRLESSKDNHLDINSCCTIN